MSWDNLVSDGKKQSTTRAIAILTVPALIIIPLLIWALLSLKNGKIQDMPLSVTGYISSLVTMIFGTLHLNKRLEAKKEPK